MAHHYLMKYKGTYRLKPELDKELHDFPRDHNGEIDESYDDIYIDCQNGNRIYYYGRCPNISGVLLWAYIPSVIRGKNILKRMDALSIPYFHYFETDEEISFKFKPKDIDDVASLLHARTYGANISPFSPRNLPKPEISIDESDLALYKEITASLDKSDYLVVKRFTDDFCSKILSKTMRKKDRSYSFSKDIRQNKMSRSVKTYIWKMGFWKEYIDYLHKKLKTYLKTKNKD